jgi:3',5'-cyclic AMP phosphodiesterase CpdA
MRILHISDLHLDVPWGGVPYRAWMGKRLVGGANLLFGRGKVYADAHRKIPLLDGFRREQGADLVICTGDYTALGTEAELASARADVDALLGAPLGCASVPGNHDMYAIDTWRKRRFEHHFGDTMTTDLPEYRVDGRPWPYARLVGDDLAIVAVNSARPRPLWSSTGRIPRAQLEALKRVLADDRLAGRFVFVITHYASRLEDGRPDKRSHRLVNADAFLEVVADLPRGALLCGHVHRRYMVRIEGVRPPLFCAGSSTKAGREGLWVFDIDADRGLATPGHFSNDAYVLEPAAAARL